MRILITAGPTCEDLDPVRTFTNRSSGRMGYAVAAEAVARGHDVVLISGPTSLAPPAGAAFEPVRSAADMLRACLDAFDGCDAAVLTAAVADYCPAEPSPTKIKKTEGDLVVRLRRTEDIAAHLGRAKGGQIIIGFDMEDADGRKAAGAKLEAKHWDAVVLNHPDAFGADELCAEIFAPPAQWTAAERMTKARLASRLLDLIEQRVGPAG